MASAMESRAHCKLLSPEKWANDPRCLIQILAPCISRYEVAAGDACIQAQLDVFGKDHIGVVPSSLATAGTFGAVMFSDSSPERLTLLAYAWEVLSFNEEFEKDMADLIGSEITDPFARDPKFENPIWEANVKTALNKALTKIAEYDSVLAPTILKKLNEMASLPQLGARMEEYTSFEEFANDRIKDVAWPVVLATAQFGADVHLTEEEESSVEHVFWPLAAHATCSYDYFGYEKDIAMGKEVSDIPSGIMLFQRLENLSFEDARSRVQAKAWQLEREYLRRKEEYFKAHSMSSISRDLMKWFQVQEALASGFAVWSMTTSRHHPPFGAAYETLYAERKRVGAVYFDRCSISDPVLTGGCEAKVARL